VVDPADFARLRTDAAELRTRARALREALADVEDGIAVTLDGLAAGAAARGGDDEAAELNRLAALARQQAVRARLSTAAPLPPGHDGTVGGFPRVDG
jgi:hypothetical protein